MPYYYLPSPSGAPQMFYRRTFTRFSDGSHGRGLEYFSPDFQTWRGTNHRDPEAHIAARLVPCCPLQVPEYIRKQTA